MARFNRINLDGKSVTETRISEADILPGTALKITADKFVAAANGEGAIYIANVGNLVGLAADEAIEAGNSIEGEYLETGREIAVLVAAATVVTMDMPLEVGAGGVFTAVDAGVAVAYAKEDYTVGNKPELIWVRGA